MEIAAADPVTAWWEMTSALIDVPRSEAFHTVARIGTDPLPAGSLDPVDALLRERHLQSVGTVANTIFPSAMAHGCADVVALGERYRALYQRLRMFSKNTNGTYFGRLVAYPIDGGTKDQLVHTVEKLRTEAASTHRSSRYECCVYHSETDSSRAMGFPCLSSCAFHVDHHAQLVHMLATYRNQHLVERGLGNYLGLARLRDYIASEAGLVPGELMVVAGHAFVDGPKGTLRDILDQVAALIGAT